MANIGSGRMAGSIVSDLRGEVDKAMADAKNEIRAGTTTLVATIRDGSRAVRKAIEAEAMRVQQEFGQIVGNAEEMAEDAVKEAKGETVPLPPNANGGAV